MRLFPFSISVIILVCVCSFTFAQSTGFETTSSPIDKQKVQELSTVLIDLSDDSTFPQFIDTYNFDEDYGRYREAIAEYAVTNPTKYAEVREAYQGELNQRQSSSAGTPSQRKNENLVNRDGKGREYPASQDVKIISR